MKKDEQQRKRMARPITPMCTAELQKQDEFTRQYYQGRSVSDMHGLGCRFYLLGVSNLPFISPLNMDMHFEIMSGTGDNAYVCIQVSEETDDRIAQQFSFPAHISVRLH